MIKDIDFWENKIKIRRYRRDLLFNNLVEILIYELIEYHRYDTDELLYAIKCDELSKLIMSKRKKEQERQGKDYHLDKVSSELLEHKLERLSMPYRDAIDFSIIFNNELFTNCDYDEQRVKELASLMLAIEQDTDVIQLIEFGLKSLFTLGEIY